MDYAAALNLISPSEGNFPHMYLDTVGLVTVGIGNMLPLMQSAQALPFVRRASQERASAGDIATDYRSVSAAEKGRRASAYRALTQLDLPADEISALFNRRVDEFVVQLERIYPGYTSFPDGAQLGILDMVFNLGAGALAHKWPKFSAAVRAGDWSAASIASHRPKSHDARNKAVLDLFLSAARSG